MEKPTKRLRAKSTELTTTSLPLILQDSISTKEFKYGTAGFRDNHGLLRGVLIRVGILAALKSRLHEGKKVIGLMVTASHNPECDNGVKIVDFDGGMLSQSWEPYAEDLVNADSESKAMEVLSSIESREGNKEDNDDKDVKKDVSEAVVLIGRDTRPHSEALFGFAQRGAMAMGAVVLDAGEVTTPQLHYLVLKMNSEGYRNPIRVKEIYFSTLAEGFIELLQTHEDEGKRRPHIRLLLDGSNGIGALQVIPLINTINALQQGTLEVDIRNKVGDGPVNEGCGAEIVQKTQLPPLHFNAVKDLNITAASFDGDADRIVFHSFRTPPKSLPSSESSLWSLVDGDKIAALISLFFLEELTALDWLRSWKFGVVQTAYANGASTLFLKSQSVRILYAKTGVKYVHEKAHSFDVGVYFEANGHGTVLFSSALQQELQSAFRLRSSRVNNRKSIALRRLQACTKVINQAVGDAMSGLLLCFAILSLRNMTFDDWCGLYTDLPSKQCKIDCAAKASIICSEDETQVVAPEGLQAALNEAMKRRGAKSRCFVRPSGTEDCVRIYAEAKTQADANLLAEDAAAAIRKFLG